MPAIEISRSEAHTHASALEAILSEVEDNLTRTQVHQFNEAIKVFRRSSRLSERVPTEQVMPQPLKPHEVMWND